MAASVRKSTLLVSVTLAVLAGCASPSRYPSLATRDLERATGILQPAEAEPYVPPATPAETLDRLGRLTADAQAAHEAFLASAERARAPVAGARGTAEGSDRWSVAQIALADLDANRSRTMISLAELDRLYVDAELAAAEVARISEARDQVSALIAAETETIDNLRGSL